jgi:hypothetical protein
MKNFGKDSEVLTVTIVKMAVIWGAAPWNLIR